MHLVKEGLHNEVLKRLESGDVLKDDRMWYAGYCMDLLQANYLTQEEHDEELSIICTMFDEYEERKGGANGQNEVQRTT